MFNSDLVTDAARQKVIPFLGAGVSASALTSKGTRIKGWHKYLEDLCEKVEPSVAAQVAGMLAIKDYLLASEILKKSLASSWEDFLVEEFAQKADPSDLHKAIARLDQRIVLTTNFDKLLETSLENKMGGESYYPQVINELNSRAFRCLKDHTSKYVVKIHGTIDNAAKIVFSRSEYIKFAFGNELYASFLENLLLNYTFLFIGFSMDDPAICSVMEMYSLRYPEARPHYIMLPKGLPENLKEIYRNLRHLIIIEYNDSVNHSDLPPLIENLATQALARRKSLLSSTMNI